MEVEIKAADVIETSNSDGKVFYKQMALLLCGGPYPLPFKLKIPQGRPYAPGRYRFTDDTFRTGRFGDLEVDPFSLSLIPIK